MTWETQGHWALRLLKEKRGMGGGPGRVGRFCWYGETTCHAVRTHTLIRIRVRPKMNWETLRVLYILVIGQFLKLILCWILFFFLLFFFPPKHRKFFKGIWSSQNSPTCSRIRITSRFLTSQYIYTWVIRNRKTLSLSPTNYLKKPRKHNFRDAKVKVIHPWSNCTFLIL